MQLDRLVLETKFAAEEDGSIEGIAWAWSPDRIGDEIAKGSFKSAKLPIPLLFGHDQNDPIGVVTEAIEESEGLRIKGNLLVNEVARAREVRALVKSGAVRGISIGFLTKSATPTKGGGRLIKALEWLEASLVAIPMHPGARVTSAKSAIEAIRIAEAINRTATALRSH